MIYTASRIRHAPMWRGFREDGVHIISTWIDEAGEGETDSFAELWQRIQSEIIEARKLVFYAEPEDFPLKGALVEVGIAMAWQKPIIVCLPGVKLEGVTLRPVGSWIMSELVTRQDSLPLALGKL